MEQQLQYQPNGAQRCRDTLRYFAASTSAHGFRKLSHPARSLQISWLVLISCAVCCFGAHLGSLLVKFYDEPITTKVNPKGTEFLYPDITVCNKMMFGVSNIFHQHLVPTHGGHNETSAGWSKLQQQQQYQYVMNPAFRPLYEDIQQVRDILNQSVRHYLLSRFGAYEQDQDKLKMQDDCVYNLPNQVIRDTYGIQRVSQFAAQAHQMLLRCSFGSLACDHRDFLPLTLPSHSSCMTFSQRRFLQRRRGVEVSNLNELSLVLFTDSAQRDHGVNAALADIPGDTFNMQTNGGATVFIHQPRTYPTNGQSVEASCGQETIVNVRYQEHVAKNRRKDPCQSGKRSSGGGGGGGATERYMVVQNGRVTLAEFAQVPHDCRIRVAQRVLLETCGFVDHNLPVSQEFLVQPRRANLSRLLDSSLSVSDPGDVIDEVSAMFSASRRGNQSAYRLPAVLQRLLGNETCLRKARILAAKDSRLSQCLYPCHSGSYTTSFMSAAWPVTTVEFLRPLVERWLRSNAFYLNGSSARLDQPDAAQGTGVNEEFVRLTTWNLYNTYSQIGSGATVRRNLLALRVRVASSQGRGLRTEESWGYAVPDMLSDIGGILGLYLGMSLLTLCEMAELLVQLSKFTRLARLGAARMKKPLPPQQPPPQSTMARADETAPWMVSGGDCGTPPANGRDPDAL